MGRELSEFLSILRQCVKSNQPDFTNQNSFSDDEFEFISRITKEPFHELLPFCDPIAEGNNRKGHKRKKDLFMFLCKVHEGLSDSILQIIFHYSTRQAVCLAVSTVRSSLMIHFITQNICMHAITREEYIRRHVTDFANTLYNRDEAQKLLHILMVHIVT